MTPGANLGPVTIYFQRLLANKPPGEIADRSLSALSGAVDVKWAHYRNVHTASFSIAQHSMLTREFADRIDPSAVGYRSAGRGCRFNNAVCLASVDLTAREVDDAFYFCIHKRF